MMSSGTLFDTSRIIIVHTKQLRDIYKVPYTMMLWHWHWQLFSDTIQIKGIASDVT